MFGRRSVPMHPEDQRLVEIAGELCRQLHFNASPQTINWRDRIGIRRVPPDYVMIFRGGLYAGSLQLSKAAMGRLTPEEWRPLLAAGIAYYKNLNFGMLRALLPTFAIALLEPFILVGSFEFLNTPQLALVRDLVLGLLFVLLGLAFVLSLRGMKGLHFKADQRAAQLVGKESLVSSLTKMASIAQSISTNRKGLIRPGPNERINHLMNPTGAI